MLMAIILPIAMVFVYAEAIRRDVYKDTFYAELTDKVDRLATRKNKKIIFVGGSSLIFGLRSEEIEKATGYDVVDFGLYASLGTVFMMKQTEQFINKGDVVVLAPEINSQTYSTYVGYNAALKCYENKDYHIWNYTLTENMKFFFHYFEYALDKANANIELNEPYTKSSFNEYCDIDSEVVNNNKMIGYYDSTQPIKPCTCLLNEDFIKKVNEYNSLINKKGAKLFFSFSPTNKLSLINDNVEGFEKSLEEKLDCDILGSVNDFTYHQYYFYDTNFHLNRTGSYLHSKNISDKLKQALLVENEYVIPTEEPPLPENFETDIVESIDGAKYKQVYANKQLTYSLIEIEDELKDVSTFEIPSELNGISVTSYGDRPFKDMPNLTKVIVPSSITSMMYPLFSNCPGVTGVYLRHKLPPLVCSTGLIDGAHSSCLIYVPKSSLKSYMSDYSWSNYRSIISFYEEEAL